MKNTVKNSLPKASSLKRRLAFRFLTSMKNLNKISSSKKDYRRQYAIRAAAYASMASAVGSRKAWSRAILRNMRNKHKLVKQINIHPVRKRAASFHGNPSLNELSDLVPGGEAMDSWRLLNETGHYIKCLRTQVQIMRKILDFSST